jgi:exopolysaccharide production protein ExoY
MSYLGELRGDSFTHASSFSRPMGSLVKRAVDVLSAVCAILLLAPLLIICFATVFLTTGGSPIFRHRRIGFAGVPFDCLKFRTMHPDADGLLLQQLFEQNPAAKAEWLLTRKLKFDPRVTAIGSVFRKTSLDELPQLFNVLRGDMSLIGPRPVTEEELGQYSSAVFDYVSCRPGITGLWQVSGRSSTTFRTRVRYDKFYAHNWSLKLDALILLKTIPAVLETNNSF